MESLRQMFAEVQCLYRTPDTIFGEEPAFSLKVHIKSLVGMVARCLLVI